MDEAFFGLQLSVRDLSMVGGPRPNFEVVMVALW